MEPVADTALVPLFDVFKHPHRVVVQEAVLVVVQDRADSELEALVDGDVVLRASSKLTDDLDDLRLDELAENHQAQPQLKSRSEESEVAARLVKQDEVLGVQFVTVVPQRVVVAHRLLVDPADLKSFWADNVGEAG